VETVKINSESILNAIVKHFGQDNMTYFENVTGKEITSFTNMFFNLVVFDMHRWKDYLNTRNSSRYSTEKQMIELYGEEFTSWFRENIILSPHYSLGVILWPKNKNGLVQKQKE
jgi:hemerythrin superfamily protein